MFHFLVDDYPDSIRLSDGKDYRVVTDYKAVLKILMLLEDCMFDDSEKFQITLKKFYIDEINDSRLFTEAYNEIFKFIGLYNDSAEEKEGTSGAKIFDFEVDSASIYAAFLQLYHIDLREKSMHWFKFMALLNNINDGKPTLVNTMQIRSMTESDMKDMSPETKSKYRKAKRKHALTKIDTEAQKASVFDKVVNTLKKGGGADG